MRALVVWCPDWPVVAALGEADPGTVVSAAAAVLEKGRIRACNPAARAQGVRRDQRRRDAQARCPELVLFEASPERDARAFEPVLAAVEALRPGVAPLRPGLLAIRAPGRFYGGEENAAAVIAEALVGIGVWDCRIGVADDLFTAEQAARSAEPQGWRVVGPGAAAGFLAGLPVAALDDPALTEVLQRLGIGTLGEFAALPAREVLTRFGEDGARAHRLARGADPMLPASRVPPADLDVEAVFEPPLESVEAVCFSVRRSAEEFVARIGSSGTVCTAVRIEAEGDDAARSLLSARTWVHSRWFTAVDLVDRVHWQLQAGPAGPVPGAPVALVRFRPETVEPASAYAEGLWGGGGDERVDRGVARVQALLGYDAVVVPVLQGGRSPGDRQALVPWGERPVGLRPVERPWPGGVPAPAPGRVFAEPWASAVLDTEGRPVVLTERGELSAPPARLHTGAAHGWRQVGSWAGPWPAGERWWEREAAAPVARCQVLDVDGLAWLLRVEGDRWWTEARYD